MRMSKRHDWRSLRRWLHRNRNRQKRVLIERRLRKLPGVRSWKLRQSLRQHTLRSKRVLRT